MIDFKIKNVLVACGFFLCFLGSNLSYAQSISPYNYRYFPQVPASNAPDSTKNAKENGNPGHEQVDAHGNVTWVPTSKKVHASHVTSSSASSNPSAHLPQSAQWANNPTYYIKANEPCWDAAAAYHHVDPWLLYAIAYVESRFQTKALGKNTNGSVDMGMMQINSIWYANLKRQGIPLSALHNACASTYIGAWILSKNIQKYGYTWRAIGAYNSATPSIGYKYAQRVYRAHALLVKTHNPQSLNGLSWTHESPIPSPSQGMSP